ncbi:MAG: hypothetical protein R3F49_15865 [Planctomycetota bacterium]
MSGLTASRADAAGNAVFDHVILQPHASGTTGWQIPYKRSTARRAQHLRRPLERHQPYITIGSFGYHLP